MQNLTKLNPELDGRSEHNLTKNNQVMVLAKFVENQNSWEKKRNILSGQIDIYIHNPYQLFRYVSKNWDTLQLTLCFKHLGHPPVQVEENMEKSLLMKTFENKAKISLRIQTRVKIQFETTKIFIDPSAQSIHPSFIYFYIYLSSIYLCIFYLTLSNF